MKQIIRRHSSGKLVLLEFLYGSATPNFYTARAYSPTKQITVDMKENKVVAESIAKCNIEGVLFYDMGQLDLKGNALEKSHTDVYRLIDQLFPELLNKGLKAEGYVKLTVQDVQKAFPRENFS